MNKESESGEIKINLKKPFKDGVPQNKSGRLFCFVSLLALVPGTNIITTTQDGLSSGWSFIRVEVSHQGGFYQDGLSSNGFSWGSSFMKVIFHRTGWSLIRAVVHQGGL